MSTTAHNSAGLVEAARRGDKDALDALIRAHLPGLRTYIRVRGSGLVREKESESDLMQTVCREALGSLDSYEWRGEGSFRYWLFAVALNKLMKKREFYLAEKRDARREVDVGAASTSHGIDRVADEGASPTQNAVAQETAARLEAALLRIPEQYREVVLLSRVVGLDHAEIAEKLGKSEGNVRVLLSRALARLMTAMQQVKADRIDP